MVVQGPAGCGKSTVLATWREQLLSAGVDVGWLALERGDNELGRGLDHLLAALSDVDEAITREALFFAGRGDDEDSIERLVIAVVRGISARRGNLVLVFDDLHHWQEPRLLHALQLLLDYAPSNLQCVLASRTAVPLSLSRLRAQNEVLELGFDDLRFSTEESAALLRSQLSEVSEQEIHALHELTDGWAAGLQLLCLEKRGRRRAEYMRTPLAFAHYFEREVLSRLSADELHSLVCAAAPERFSASLCAALIEHPGAMSDSHALPTRLEHENLFVMPADGPGPETWWRMHPLLRDVLLARFHELPGVARQFIHRHAWHAFAARGMTHDAVRHAVQAGAPDAAVDLVEASAPDLFVRGELRQLASLVRQLPPAVLARRTGLRLWLAWLQVFEHRLDECGESIRELLVVLDPADGITHYRLVLLRGLYAVQRDDTDGAMAVLTELMNPPPNADGIALAGRRNILTWIHLYRGHYEEAREVQLEPALPLIGGEPLYGTPFGTLGGQCLLGLTHAVEGQMIQAERIYRDVLYEAEKRGSACIDAACLAAGLLGEILYEMNSTDAAVRLLENRIDVLEQVSIPDTVLRVMLVMGRARRLAGLPLEGFGFMDRLEDYAVRRRLDRLLAYSLLEQMRWHLRDQNPAAAHACIARLDKLGRSHAQAENSALGEVMVVVERASIELCTYSGELEVSYARLIALIALCAQRGRQRRVAALHVQCAAIERRRGHHKSASQHMHHAMRGGHRLGLLRSLLDAHEEAVVLAQEAARAPGQDPLLVFYAERLVAASRIASAKVFPVPVTVAKKPGVLPLADLSERESDVVQLLAQALPNKKIARVLGLSPETVKWHLKNIYGKLGVMSRDEVVAQVRQSLALDEGSSLPVVGVERTGRH